MKKNKNILFLNTGRFYFLLIAIFFINTSCNEEFANKLEENYPATDFEENNSSVNGKVLFIIIDGVAGETVRTLAPTNILKLTKNSIYSYNGIVDAEGNRMTEAASWANLLTGVSSNLHQVTSEDFNGNQLDQYPSIVTLMKDTNPELKTALYASSTLFVDYFGNDFNEVTVNNDNDIVATSVVNELQNNNSDFVIAQFNKAKISGDTFGYPDSSEYVNSIIEIDDYIGNMVETLKARSNYQNENWMIVISTSTGGELATNGSGIDPLDDKSRNIFTLFNNKRFNPRVITKPVSTDIKYAGFGVSYSYENNNFVNASLQNPAYFDFGSNGEMTIQFMIKSKPADDGWYGYPTFLSKRAAGFNGAGWNMFLEGDYWVLNSSFAGQLYGTKISDNQWHTITAVFTRVGTVRTAKIFTDGILNAQQNANTNSMSNNTPLRIGRIPNDGDGTPNVTITNLQIYNRSFTQADVTNLSCLPVIKESHPYYENLIGYWPSDEVDQNILKERTGKLGNDVDLKLTGPFVWKDFNDSTPNVCPQALDSFFRLVPNSTDTPFQILQWLGVRIHTNWSLDGKGWSPIYKDITP